MATKKTRNPADKRRSLANKKRWAAAREARATPLGKAMRAMRQAAGLRLEDVADALSANYPHAAHRPATICRWELGEFEPRASELAAYAAVCGGTVGQLYGEG